MCSAKLEMRTVEVYKKFFTGSVFDMTLLDEYLTHHKVSIDLLFSLHSYIYENEGSLTFSFTSVFDIEFQKVVDMFLSLHSQQFVGSSTSYTIDVMNLQHPILFKSSDIQGVFERWLKGEG